jgi:hypothetical protein
VGHRSTGLARAGAAVLLIACASWAPAEENTTRLPLLDAAARGDRARVSALLAAGADPDARDDEGRPALLLAAASGQPGAGALRALLRGGADPEAATASGWTPLHAAAAVGDREAVGVLLAAGVDPDRPSRSRGTPLDVAERGDRRDVARLLRERGARGSGESIGDIVCVRGWAGDGYCGVVLDRDGTRHRLSVTGIVGCDGTCEADAACSGGRLVGPGGGLAPGDRLWVPTSCLTHTGLR